MPALATSRSMPPVCSAKASIACLTDALSVTSQGRTCAVPPRRPTSSASASSSLADRAASPIVAPRAASRSVSARPMPREAPVTNALVPDPISTPTTLPTVEYHGPNDDRSCDRGRGGVPPDPVLAPRGGPADDRRQRRPGHAALAADGPRDDR